MPIAPARPCVVVYSLNILKHTRYAHSSHVKIWDLCLQLVARASRATQLLLVPVLRACELRGARAHLSQCSCLICAHCGCSSVLWCKIFETHVICLQLSCKERVFMFALVACALRATQLLLVPVSRACELKCARRHLPQFPSLICAHCVCSSVHRCI